MTILSMTLISLGVVFLVVSAVGVNVLPDVYTRAHAVAKSETFAVMLIYGGLLLHPHNDIASTFRLAFILLFSLLANPTAVHAFVRAAMRTGTVPWTVIDQATADAELGGFGRDRP